MKFIMLFLFPLLLYSSSISSKFSYYEDKSNLTFQTIKTQTFIPLKDSYLNMGFNHNNIWIKIEVSNSSDSETEQVLSLSNPTINFLDFYSEEKLLSLKGNHRSKEITDIDEIYFTFKLNMKQNSTSIFYLKINTRNTLSVKFFIDNIDNYKKNVDNKKIFLVFFFGFVSSIIIYNFFLFLILKDKIYLYYISMQSVLLLLFLAFSGLGSYLIWQESYNINSFILRNFDDFGIILALVFIQKFLHIKRYSKRLNIGINVVIVFLFINMIAPFQHSFSIFMMPVMLLGILLILLITIYGIYKKIPTAKLFFFGWFVLLTGSMLTLLKNFGYLEFGFLTYWGMYVGLMLESVIFSIVLAKKIEILKQEKEKVLKDSKILLDIEVELKTKELKETLEQKELLLKEVNHRTKNSLQIISSFIGIVSTKEKNETLKANYKALNDKIHAISSLHEFYNTSKLNNINTKEYITSIINNLAYLTPKNKNIQYKIEICEDYINTSQLTTLGLIINELITNSLKHAFSDKELGIIEILLYKEDEFHLVFKDNGIGFDFDNEKRISIGLKLIDRLARKQLGSEIYFSNEDGSHYTFKFKVDNDV